MNNVLPQRWESLVFLNVPSSSVWQGPGWQVFDSTSLIHEFKATMRYIFMQMQVHFGIFYHWQTQQNSNGSLEGFCFSKHGCKVLHVFFCKNLPAQRKWCAFCLASTAIYSLGMNRRIGWCKRAPPTDSFIKRRDEEKAVSALFC